MQQTKEDVMDSLKHNSANSGSRDFQMMIASLKYLNGVLISETEKLKNSGLDTSNFRQLVAVTFASDFIMTKTNVSNKAELNVYAEFCDNVSGALDEVKKL